MKPLTLEETRLKEEMKDNCLTKGQYIDKKAEAKFKMLCHLEDFEVQYWKLQQENKKLTGAIQTYDILLKSNVEENKQLKIQISAREEVCNKLENNWNKLKEYVAVEWYSYDNDSVEFEVAKDILNKMRELEQGSDSNV